MAVLFTRRGAAPRLTKKASDYAVGDIVKIPVNSVDKEFIVVQQGRPDATKYSTTCDGTWLLMKDLFLQSAFGGNDILRATALKTINAALLKQMSASAVAQTKYVKIPYGIATGIYSAENGLPTNVFPLSSVEVGADISEGSQYGQDVGVLLDYFILGNNSAAANAKRIANYNGTAEIWWTRSMSNTSSQICAVTHQGAINSVIYTANDYFRPAFVLSYDAEFDSITNRLIEIPSPVVSTTATITGSGDSRNCYAKINGTTYTTAASGISVSAGDVITFEVLGSSSRAYGSIKIQNIEIYQITSGRQDFQWVVPCGVNGIQISLLYSSSSYGRITVTTS